MESSTRKNEIGKRTRNSKNALVDYVLDEIEKDNQKIGVLFCEGDENSIDKAVYSAIFPEFIVYPLGGCGSIPKILGRLKRRLACHKVYVFAIIDRDALSKSEIKQLYKTTGVYTTKVPFIENIICSPEVISYVCKSLEVSYEEMLERIQTRLMRMIWIKMKNTLPINLGIDKQEPIEFLKFSASTGDKTIEKVVEKGNILYAYRSKRIVSIVANELHMRNKEEYYKKIKQMLDDERYRSRLIKVMANLVPDLKLYNFDEV